MHVLSLALWAIGQTAPPPSTTTPPPTTTTTPAPAAATDCRIVVLDLQAKDLAVDEANLPAVLTESLATEAAVVSGCQMVTSADVREMLDFEATKAAACVDGASSCLAEIGSALGADRVIGGTVTKLGTQWLVSARLMNVAQGSVEVRTEQVASAPEQQRGAAQNAARALFHQPLRALPAPSTSTATPTAAPASTPNAALFWTGAGAATLGGLALLGGGVLAGVAEAQLADPAGINKSATTQTGQLGLVVAAVGAAVTVGGVVLALGGT
jgi:hypothetical protein